MESRNIDHSLYELVFIRHPSTDPYRSVTFPKNEEYASRDLFSKHPTKPNLWAYEGRSDDLIVFSNVEKFNPGGMEGILHFHSDLSQVLVIGQARFQLAALNQLKGQPSLTDDAKKQIIESLPHYVDKANNAAPGFAKLQRDLIIFTHPEKPMVLADKGTVKRGATTKAYEHEIDQIYADAEFFATSLSAIHLNARDLPALNKAILECLIAIVGLKDLKADQDIFAAGMDSLQVLDLVRQLKSFFTGDEGGIPAHLITFRIIYPNSTAKKISCCSSSV